MALEGDACGDCPPTLKASLRQWVLPYPNPDLRQQLLPERPECCLASVNLVVVAEPTFPSVLPDPNSDPTSRCCRSGRSAAWQA